jgi:hypothetical protein
VSAAGHLRPGQFEQAIARLAEAATQRAPHSRPSLLPSSGELYGGHIQQGHGGGLHVGGEPVQKLYRVVDPGEWQDAQSSGSLQSRGGYTRASAKPDERWRHQGEAGVRGHTLEIDYDPADKWHASAEGYAATHAPIPLTRVRRLADQREREAG